MDHYTIGVKRRFWFGYKKYLVVKHVSEGWVECGPQLERCLIAPRLVLTQVDGALVVVSNIQLRDWVIYPDFKAFKESRLAAMQGAEAAKE